MKRCISIAFIKGVGDKGIPLRCGKFVKHPAPHSFEGIASWGLPYKVLWAKWRGSRYYWEDIEAQTKHG